jgi:hypothetical protein
MLLIYGNEFGPKTQAYDGNADLLVTGHEMVPLEVRFPDVRLLRQARFCRIACRIVGKAGNGKGLVGIETIADFL